MYSHQRKAALPSPALLRDWSILDSLQSGSKPQGRLCPLVEMKLVIQTQFFFRECSRGSSVFIILKIFLNIIFRFDDLFET